MTQSLTPGFSLTDNLLLTEELPAPPQATYRVWFALNVQLGQIVVVKVHADGSVESVENKAIPVPSPVVETPPAPAWDIPKPAPSVYVPPSPPPNFRTQPKLYAGNHSPAAAGPGMSSTSLLRKRWLRYVMSALVVLGSAIALYHYRRPIERYVKKVGARISANSAPSTFPSDSVSTTSSDRSSPDNVPADAGSDLMVLPPPTVDPNEPPPPIDPVMLEPSSSVAPSITPVTAQQASRLLNLLVKIPPEKHPAIFADARQAYTNLRQASGRQSYIDSLYIVCMGRGAQSVLTYQQNGDSVSKRYAIDWYQTAYALKPTPALQDRLTRLTNGAPKQRAKPVRKASASADPLFMPDPEVTR